MNEIMTIDEHKQRKAIIGRITQDIMKPGEHYAKIPGCGNKPVLLQPGAQALCSHFMIRPRFEVEDISTNEIIRYRVTCTGETPDGTFVGSGMGEANTDEEKYKWRDTYSRKEWEETSEDRRRHKWDRSGRCRNQIRTNPFDHANTILKMSCKRAFVHMVLNATSASDWFTQDVDDFVEPQPPSDEELARRLKENGRTDESGEPAKKAGAGKDATGKKGSGGGSQGGDQSGPKAGPARQKDPAGGLYGSGT